MILITGATGSLGKSTIDFLLKEIQPDDLAALVRDPQKAEALRSRNVPLRQGDYEDYESLENAFYGVDQLLFISTSATGEARKLQHANVVKAASQAGIKHVYYTSIVNPTADATFSATPGHYETEKNIKEAGLSYTFFRNNIYMDLVPALIGNADETGTLYFAAGDQRVGFVLREEIAEAIANVILDEKREKKVYTLSAPTTYSFYDLAVALGKAINHPIKYVPITTQDMRNSLKEAEVPEPTINISTNLADAIQKGEFDYPDDTLRKLILREPVDLELFMKQFYMM